MLHDGRANGSQASVWVDSMGMRWAADLARALPISIPLRFDGPQPNAFGLPEARAEVVLGDGFTGDTRRGGSVNCHNLRLNAHGNGTHTECVGHVVDDHIAVRDVVHQLLIVTRLVSVAPTELRSSGEHYADVAEGDDRVVTRRALQRALSGHSPQVPEHSARFAALVIRTLPNDPEKRWRRYGGSNPPYMTIDAVRYVRDLGIEHLLLDLPSVDRERDAGHLCGHREFWGLPPRGCATVGDVSRRTITEFVYAPDDVSDGWYLLSLQIPDFVSESAPSRPVLYAVSGVAPLTPRKTAAHTAEFTRTRPARIHRNR